LSTKASRSSATSSAGGYFPLEPTLEECLDGLDTSYDAPAKTNPADELFATIFNNKESSDVDMFLSTLSSFAQNKSKLVELLKSLSSIKATDGQEDTTEADSSFVRQLFDKKELRCQEALVQQLEEEEEEEEELMQQRQDNLEEEFMEDDEEEEEEEEAAGDSAAFERGLQRMRELNRRQYSAGGKDRQVGSVGDAGKA